MADWGWDSGSRARQEGCVEERSGVWVGCIGVRLEADTTSPRSGFNEVKDILT